MTDALLLGLLKANIAGGLLILLVFLLRKPVLDRFGARVAYGLWLLPTFGALASLFPARTAPPVTAASPVSTELGEPFAATGGAVATLFSEATVRVPFHLAGWLVGAWIAGVALSLGWLAIRQWQFSAEARRGRAGPAVVGFLRPRLVLPVDFERRCSEGERSMILMHEARHVARQDPRVVGLAVLARCINWFNPLVHLAVHQLRMDQELACDADVVARLPGAKRAYAEAMLKTQMAGQALPLGCQWPARSTHPLEERIRLLSARQPGQATALTGTVLVALMVLAGGLGAWAAQPTKQGANSPTRTSPLGDLVEQRSGATLFGTAFTASPIYKSSDQTARSSRAGVVRPASERSETDVVERTPVEATEPLEQDTTRELQLAAGPEALGPRADPLAPRVIPASAPVSTAPAGGDPAPLVDRLTWLRQPTFSEKDRVFQTTGGLGAADSARVTLRCLVNGDGAVSSCVVLSERFVWSDWPKGSRRNEALARGRVEGRFGKAALSLSSMFVMTPPTVNGVPVSRASVVIPVEFRSY